MNNSGAIYKMEEKKEEDNELAFVRTFKDDANIELVDLTINFSAENLITCFVRKRDGIVLKGGLTKANLLQICPAMADLANMIKLFILTPEIMHYMAGFIVCYKDGANLLVLIPVLTQCTKEDTLLVES